MTELAKGEKRGRGLEKAASAAPEMASGFLKNMDFINANPSILLLLPLLWFFLGDVMLSITAI